MAASSAEAAAAKGGRRVIQTRYKSATSPSPRPEPQGPSSA